MKAEPRSPSLTRSGSRTSAELRSGAERAAAKQPRRPVEIATEVATVLAGMTYPERVRAYRSGTLSAHELALAAGRFPEEMPMLNGEFEWIAISLE